jgi:ABC-type hemin transport system ATPase subunit
VCGDELAMSEQQRGNSVSRLLMKDAAQQQQQQQQQQLLFLTTPNASMRSMHWRDCVWCDSLEF